MFYDFSGEKYNMEESMEMFDSRISAGISSFLIAGYWQFRLWTRKISRLDKEIYSYFPSSDLACKSGAIDIFNNLN